MEVLIGTEGGQPMTMSTHDHAQRYSLSLSLSPQQQTKEYMVVTILAYLVHQKGEAR